MKKIIALGCLITFLVYCGPAPTSRDSSSERIVQKKPVRVAVSILPQKYFVQRIGGTDMAVQVMIPPGYSPATYAPTPGQIRKLADVDLYFKTGHLPFENFWMEKIKSAAPDMKIIDTSEGIQHIGGHHHHEHKNGEHHASLDPHTWLSPSAVKIQCQNIRNALMETVPPEKKQDILVNCQRFVSEIDRLDTELRAIFEPYRHQTLLVFHPAWGYFARDYNLSQMAIESEGKEPTPKRLIELIKEGRIRKNPVIFIQRQFDRHSAQAIADEIKGEVVVLDPLAEDWLKNMREMSQIISEHLFLTEQRHSHE